ncbi:MAG: ribosome-associated translation inhibitor RaiA [Verrucomicrobia bacterium]|nr:ribosome-associated translation inhibitor RaiA [Verrucomicrobiota bacterium]
MKTTITGHHFDLDDDLRAYATERIERLQKFTMNIVDAHLVVDHVRAAYKAEVIVRADHQRFFGEDSLPDARASVDSAIAKVERQLQRFKEKVQRKHKHELDPSAPQIALGEETDEEVDFEELDAELEVEAEVELEAELGTDFGNSEPRDE